MKAVFLETSTSEVQKYGDGLRSLKWGEVLSLKYDLPGGSEDLLYERAHEFKPDLIVYIGTRWGPQPSIVTLSRMTQKIAPTVHICSDAADMPWWDLLRTYHDRGVFTLQVAIDGSQKWPLASSHMTALTPVDASDYTHGDRPHAERTVMCGYAGNTGGGGTSRRTILLIEFLEKKLIDCRVRSPLPFTYPGYCAYLENCRISLNVAYSGTEAALQVKGRVVESALAGACLLETAGAPTSDWFQPGVDYLEYANSGEAEQIIRRLENEPAETQAMAQRLREKVMREHSLEAFWTRIIDRIGMKRAA